METEQICEMQRCLLCILALEMLKSHEGNRRELIETYCERSKEYSDFHKSAVIFWFSFCFPEGKGVRFYIFPYIGVHTCLKHTLALWVNVWRDSFWSEDNFGNQDVLVSGGKLCLASVEASSTTGLFLDYM